MTSMKNILVDQHFKSYQDWINRASRVLTLHPRWNEGADYSEPNPFKTICFDSLGRLCRQGGDFMRARDEGTFPVYWLWPDQIGNVVLNLFTNSADEPAEPCS